MAPLPPLPEGPSLQQIRMPLAPPAASNLLWEPFVGIALMGLLLFLCRRWLIAGLRKRLDRRHEKLSPWQQAQAELEAIQLQTDPVLFAEGLNSSLRRYLKNEYAVGLDSYSHAQLRSAIQQQLDLKPQVQLDLDQLFEHCEQIKFSQRSLDAPNRKNLQKQAQALLQQLKPPGPGSET